MITHYLRYLLRSTNAHGIHSPFVFELATKVLYDRKLFPEYRQVDDLKIRLLKDATVLDFTEMGAGKPGTRQVTVSQIAKGSAVAGKYGRLLFRLARWFQPEVVVEFGTSLGISTCWLALGMGPEGRMYTLEGNESVAAQARSNIDHVGIGEKVQITSGAIEHTLPILLKELNQVDLVYFDANHRLAPTLQYFHTMVLTAHPGSVFIFDDINWSAEMRQAWQLVQADERVTLSIDLFQFGLVFFRKNIEKQHFRIRF